MPLKASDLKTVDSYKKVKADGAKIIPGSNIKFWVYRDVELPTANGQKQKLWPSSRWSTTPRSSRCYRCAVGLPGSVRVAGRQN